MTAAAWAALAAFSCGLPAQADAPKFPAVFDEATVRSLVQNIDQDRNATILKFGYFIRRGAKGYPLQDGLALVKQSAAAAPQDSRRWFVLESVAGFAGFHLSAGAVADACHAYNAILDNASGADAAGAGADLERAIYELIASVPNWQQDQDQAAAVVVKALGVELGILKANGRSRYPIPWREAVGATEGSPATRAAETKLVDEALADPAMPRGYDFYMLAGEVLVRLSESHDRGAELLTRALALATTPDEKRRAHRYILQDLELEGQWNNNLVPVIDGQREWITRTGSGRADLVRLLKEAGDSAALQVVLDDLRKPEVDETEVNSTAAELFSVSRSDPNLKKVYQELPGVREAYLSASRKRDVEQELRARIILNDIDQAQGRPDAARAVLEPGLKVTPVTDAEKMAYRALELRYRQWQH